MPEIAPTTPDVPLQKFTSSVSNATAELQTALFPFTHRLNGPISDTSLTEALGHAKQAATSVATALQNVTSETPSAVLEAVKSGQQQISEGVNMFTHRLNGPLNTSAVEQSWQQALTSLQAAHAAAPFAPR